MLGGGGRDTRRGVGEREVGRRELYTKVCGKREKDKDHRLNIYLTTMEQLQYSLCIVEKAILQSTCSNSSEF